MRIHFVRHGESHANLRHEIANRGLQHALDVPLEVTDALREYDLGYLEGRSDEVAWREWKRLFDAWTRLGDHDQLAEGGERFADVRGRFVPFVEGLVARHGASAEEVVCVAHGGLYWTMLPLVLVDVDAEAIAASGGFGHGAHVVAEARPDGLLVVAWEAIAAARCVAPAVWAHRPGTSGPTSSGAVVGSAMRSVECECTVSRTITVRMMCASQRVEASTSCAGWTSRSRQRPAREEAGAMDGAVWILIVIAVVVLGFVGYGMARRARGSIELSLPQTAFEPGETIRGSFVLHTKKPIEARRLVVSLTASEVTKTRQQDGKTRSRSTQVFRDERTLEGEKAYPPDTRETHEFEIDVPNPEQPEALDSPIGAGMSTALRALSRSRTYLRWRLEVRLVAKGIDLVTAKQVSVNLRQL